MNQHFAMHQLWELSSDKSIFMPPKRSPVWPGAERAHFVFMNEHGYQEVLEVWAAPIVNGKPAIGAWTYDVKSGSVKIRGRCLQLEIQKGWPEFEARVGKEAEIIKTLAVPAPAQEPEVGAVVCPTCGQDVVPVAWGGKLCFPLHYGLHTEAPVTVNVQIAGTPVRSFVELNCSSSLKPVETVPIEPGSLTGRLGRYEGFEKIEALVPQTYGEALSLYPFLVGHTGHEWDNRTTAENAAWLIEKLTTEKKGKPRKKGR